MVSVAKAVAKYSYFRHIFCWFHGYFKSLFEYFRFMSTTAAYQNDFFFYWKWAESIFSIHVTKPNQRTWFQTMKECDYRLRKNKFNQAIRSWLKHRPLASLSCGSDHSSNIAQLNYTRAFRTRAHTRTPCTIGVRCGPNTEPPHHWHLVQTIV